MTITLDGRLRLVMALLLLSLAMVPRSLAQGLAPLASAASFSADLANPAQASPQQPDANLPPQPAPKQLTDYVEAGGDYMDLTNGFGYWAGGYARGTVTEGNNILTAEANGQREFGDAGVYLAASLSRLRARRSLSESSYSSHLVSRRRLQQFQRLLIPVVVEFNRGTNSRQPIVVQNCIQW
jgi:hypothetical protein